MKNYLLKACSVTMAVCLLVSALTACDPEFPSAEGTGTWDGASSGIAEDTAPETEIAEDLSVHYQTPILHKSGNTPFYEGKTLQDLYAIYQKGKGQGRGSAQMTPTGWFHYFYKGDSYTGRDVSFVSFYDKLKGEFLPLCGDPQCSGGDDCVWNRMRGVSYASADHIYFLSRNSAGYSAIYRSDHERKTVDLLISHAPEDEYVQIYNPDGTPLGEPTRLLGDRILYAQGDSVYFESTFFAGGKHGTHLCVMDVGTRKITILSGDADIESMEIVGGRVIYSLATDSYTWYETDLTFENSQKILENVEIFLCSGQYLILQKQDEDPFSTAYQSYCLDTGETVELGENLLGNMDTPPYLSGEYLYYTRFLSDDEIANDPMRNYYTYQWKELTDAGRPYVANAYTRGGGRVYRIKISEANAREECVLQLTYKDVPVRIESIETDGEMLYITFHNYEGFKNYYNKDFEGDVEDSVCYGMADLQNGTFTLLNVPEKE